MGLWGLQHHNHLHLHMNHRPWWIQSPPQPEGPIYGRPEVTSWFPILQFAAGGPLCVPKPLWDQYVRGIIITKKKQAIWGVRHHPSDNISHNNYPLPTSIIHNTFNPLIKILNELGWSLWRSMQSIWSAQSPMVVCLLLIGLDLKFSQGNFLKLPCGSTVIMKIGAHDIFSVFQGAVITVIKTVFFTDTVIFR